MKENVVPIDPTPHSPEALWQSQKEETPTMTLAEIRQKAQQFQTKIRWRNAREYAGAGLATILYGVMIWILPGVLTKIGAVVTLAAIYFVVYQLHRDGASRHLPADAAAGDCLAFHRHELERQRDLVSSVGPWHLGPMVPGLALFFTGLWMENVKDSEDALIMTISALLAATMLGLVYWLNVRAARHLQRELDQLAS
jgi:Flp pilus assembly protein TadB